MPFVLTANSALGTYPNATWTSMTGVVDSGRTAISGTGPFTINSSSVGASNVILITMELQGAAFGWVVDGGRIASTSFSVAVSGASVGFINWAILA